MGRIGVNAAAGAEEKKRVAILASWNERMRGEKEKASQKVSIDKSGLVYFFCQLAKKKAWLNAIRARLQSICQKSPQGLSQS